MDLSEWFMVQVNVVSDLSSGMWHGYFSFNINQLFYNYSISYDLQEGLLIDPPVSQFRNGCIYFTYTFEKWGQYFFEGWTGSMEKYPRRLFRD